MSRRVDGYPNPEQINYYLHVPIVMLLVAVAAFAAARLWQLKRSMLFVQIGVLICLFPYVMGYTGGM